MKIKISKHEIENLNTFDKVANEFFNVSKFGFRFNNNLRWFWGQSKTFYNFKSTLINLPLSESKIVTQIYLN